MEPPIDRLRQRTQSSRRGPQHPKEGSQVLWQTAPRSSKKKSVDISLSAADDDITYTSSKGNLPLRSMHTRPKGNAQGIF